VRLIEKDGLDPELQAHAVAICATLVRPVVVRNVEEAAKESIEDGVARMSLASD
jgi:hypothetical protein